MFVTHFCIAVFNTGNTFMKLEKQVGFSISFMLVYFTLLGGHCLHNSDLLIYFPILGAEFTTASWRHALVRNCFQRDEIENQIDKNNLKVFFFSKLTLDIFIILSKSVDTFLRLLLLLFLVDSAIISRAPLLNILVSGKNIPIAVL